MIELCLKLTNLKQENTENIAEFVNRSEVLTKELFDSHVNMSIAVAQEIFDLDHKEKLLIEYTWPKSFTFNFV